MPCVPGVICSTLHRGSCLSRWSYLHLGPPLHRHDRPPASYGMLCSKSQVAEGRRQVGPVHVACRIWARCRSLTPGSWPRASKRWSQVSRAIGSSAIIRARCPGTLVVSRQLPYPPGGPSWPEAVKVNPGGGVLPVPPGGLWSPGRSGPPGGSAPGRPAGRVWFAGSGRAHPWPVACPCSSVTVTHHVVFGLVAVARARSRARAGSSNLGANTIKE